MSRADKISPKEKLPEYYSDFPINMDKNPITGQLGRVTNAEAVKNSIVALVLTGEKERPYQPYLGSKIRQSLFDNMDDPVTIDNIKSSIIDCIKKNEDRAIVLKVNLAPSQDQNGYYVEIFFSIKNITEPQVAKLFLSRVR